GREPGAEAGWGGRGRAPDGRAWRADERLRAGPARRSRSGPKPPRRASVATGPSPHSPVAPRQYGMSVNSDATTVNLDAGGGTTVAISERRARRSFAR